MYIKGLDTGVLFRGELLRTYTEESSTQKIHQEATKASGISTMPVKPRILTKEEYKKILEFEVKSCKFRITNVKEAGIEERVGFMADHSFIEIKYEETDKENEEKALFLFAKGLPKNETFRKMVSEMQFFDKEVLFYDIISRDLAKIVKNTKIFPTCYLAKREMIILEDSRKIGFIPVKDTREAVDINHFKAALSALARFHSASIIIEKTTKQTVAELYADMIFENLFVKEGAMSKWLDAGLRACQALVSLLPKYEGNPSLVQKIQHKLAGLKGPFLKFFEYDSNACNVITHGDSWISNFLFKYKDNIPIEAILIDFQALRCAPPAFDVQLLLHHSLEYDEDRRKTMQELQDFYYQCLAVELQRYNLDLETVLPRKEFQQTCQYAELMASVAVCLYYHSTQAKPELVEKIFADQELYSKFWTQDRTEEIKKWFKIDMHFRHVMANGLENVIRILMED